MKKTILAVLIAIASMALITAAGAQNWEPVGGPEWAKVLSEAKKEGTVVVAGRPNIAKPFSENFKKDTGITLQFLGGAGREQTSRITRELRSGKVTIDVMMGGASSVNLIKPGYIEPLKPLLFLDEVKDGKYWRGGAIKWVDTAGQYMVVPAEYVFGWLAYNPNHVKADEIQSWKDLLKPEYQGKIAAYDPRSPGPGLAFAALAAHHFGVDYLKELIVDQKAALTRDSRQLVDWVSRGSYSFALSALPTHVERYRANKLPIAVMFPKDAPGGLIGGSSVTWIPKGAPHRSAAIVFVNWYLSKRGQTIYSQVWESPSRRTDVSVKGIPEYVIPKDGVKYLDQYQEDWYVNTRPKLQKEILKALGGR